MPRTRSLAWAELKIGITAVIAIALAAALVFLLSGEGGFFWQQYQIKTVFTNIAGLGPGAPVRVAGLEVGTVEDVQFLGDRVEVVMAVGKDYQSRITSGSVASLGSVSLLGESAVDITASVSGTPVPEWGYVPSGPPTGSISDVATKASAGIEQLTTILNDIQSGRGTIGQLMTNDSLYQGLNGLVGAAEQVASSITRGEGTLGRLVNDPAAAKALEASLANLESVTAKIKNGEGSLGRLLNDDSLAKSLASTTANIDGMTGRLNRGEGTLGKLFTEQQLYDRINSTTDRLDKLIAALNAGEGTMGQLLRDKQLYDNMNTTIVEMRNLLANITKDPKKYLNVRVSLF
jgi:phospholipid/cholesterol/gamma-HCH transport system substrate-binding protein